jgi:hypothetical protein
MRSAGSRGRHAAAGREYLRRADGSEVILDKVENNSDMALIELPRTPH